MTLKTWCYFVASMVVWVLASLKVVEFTAPTLGVLLPTIIMSVILIITIMGIMCWQQQEEEQQCLKNKNRWQQENSTNDEAS